MIVKLDTKFPVLLCYTAKADWVHILAMPDLYRGQYQRGDPQAVEKYLADAHQIIENISQSGKKVSKPV